MKKAIIPKEVQEEIKRIIDEQNQKMFYDRVDDLSYFPEFRGKYLYLKRKEFGNISPVARLTYTGDIKKWDFAIYKWSREAYDPDEFFFPGIQHVDGTIEGAMLAGIVAYPV